ncbi:MAG: hypothetical protein M3Y87_07510 [Myxococcota bacterium]|nr:hypothetical protein [Myxococcota bacterium]
MIGRTAIVAAFLWMWIEPSLARADLTIAAPSCTGLDVEEVRRLLAVEIEDVAAEWSAVATPVVLLGCAGEGRVRIEITDPITDKSVARTVVLSETDRERVLAIAIAQLFLTSWLELLIDDDDDRAESAAARAAERRAREALERAEARAEADADTRAEPEPHTEPEPEARTEPEAQLEPVADARPSITGELSLEGGARLRLDGEQLPTATAALRGALVIDDALIIGLRTAFEWSRATRTRGTIDAYGATIGIGAGWRSPSVGAFFVDVIAWIAPMWILLEGRPSSADVAGGTTQAIAAEATIEIAPSLRAGPVIIALALAGGGIAFAPEGIVSEERPVVVGGALLSASLRISIVPSQW